MRKKTAEITTTLTSFSLVYLTCMKINTTSSALTVAMTRAKTVLNGPRSMKATPAVTPVKTSSVSQTATLVFVGTMCSDMQRSLVPGLLLTILFLTIYQIQQRKQINPDNVDKVPVQAGVFQRRVIFGRVCPFPCVVEQVSENPD